MHNRTDWAPDDRQRGVDHADHFDRSAREDGTDTGRVTPGAITDIGGKPDKTVTPGAIHSGGSANTDIAAPGTAAPPGSITDGGLSEGDSGLGSTGRDAL